MINSGPMDGLRMVPLAERALLMLRWRGGLALALPLAAFHWLLAISSVLEKSTTCDEPIYIAGGLSYWLFDDYRLHPENGNLPQRIAAIPLLIAGNVNFPSRDNELWRTADHYRIGTSLLYGSGNDADEILLLSRAAILVLNCLTAMLIFLWSRELFGIAGGLLSLAVAVFCPTMLGYGSIVMSDMAAAFSFLFAVRFIWKAIHEVTPLSIAAGGLAVGLMCLAKMSAPLLVPMAAILFAVRIISGAPLQVRFQGRRWAISSRPWRAGFLVGVFATQAMIAWTMIWAAYGFRYQASAEGEDDFPLERRMSWEKLFEFCDWTPGGNAFRDTINFCRDNKLLPEAYLWGTAHTYRFAQKRSAYLRGEYSVTGWRSFFPYCFAVKTPVPTLVITVLAAAGGAMVLTGRLSPAQETRHGNAENSGGSSDPCRAAANVPGRDMPGLTGALYRTAPLWALLFVYWAAAISSNLNIGHRHLLPVYPPMYILCGAAAAWLRKGPRPMRAAMAACLLLLATETLRFHPHYMAYFNQFVGGPKSGYRHLVDGSLDLGQDLPGLKKWLDRNNPPGPSRQPIFLSYFGNGDPAYYGIEARDLPSFSSARQHYTIEPLVPGIYCISATMLPGYYAKMYGPWTEWKEKRWMEVRREADRFRLADIAGQEKLVREKGGEYWTTIAHDFWWLRFQRLCAVLRARDPDDNVGYSILIYRLGPADIERVMNGPMPPEFMATHAAY